MHHREVWEREAAPRPRQNKVPHPGPRDRRGAGEDHQTSSSAAPSPGILPPRQPVHPRTRLNLRPGSLQE